MKSVLRVKVYTVANQDGYEFTESDAQAVLAALKARKDIKATDNEGVLLYIPFSAVTSATYYTRLVEDDTEDANCKVRVPEEEAPSLKITDGGYNAPFTITLGDASINGKYGDVTFTNGVATVSIPENTSITVTGLPDGTSYTLSGRKLDVASGSLTGTTPAEVTIAIAAE